MPKPALRHILLLLAIAFLLVLGGHRFILQRTLNNPVKAFTIRGDTLQYVAMIEGRWSEVSAPYRYRVLVPALARVTTQLLPSGALPLISKILPSSPTGALRLISYASLFFAYLFILLAGFKLGLPWYASAAGLLAAWATLWHLYNYHNPFLTDAFGLLALCVMVYALVSDSFPLFLAAALLGCLARETAVILVPAWIIWKIRARGELSRSAALALAALAALLLPRLLLGPGPADPAATAIDAARQAFFQQPLAFARDLWNAWGFLWVPALMGLGLMPREKSGPVVVAFALLLAGAFVTALVATDTGRMFAVLTPVIALTCAQFFARLLDARSLLARILTHAFILLVLARALFTLPNIFFGYGSPAFARSQAPLLVAEIAFILLSLVALRKQFNQQIDEASQRDASSIC